MKKQQRIVCIIPARLDSKRFPRKILAPLKGKPLLQWVWESAMKVSLFDEVAFAIDAEETADTIRQFGGKYYFTAKSCQSGTERLVELNKKNLVHGDIWVNWQGDEPFITSQIIQDLLKTATTKDSDVWTLCKRIHRNEEIHSPHIVKVVRDHQNHALYFSRSPIPYYRDRIHDQHYFKHVGLYAFTQEALTKIDRMSPCEIEQAEQLEQLRFLYNGLKVKVHETSSEVFGIDIPEHLTQAEKYLEGLT